MQRSTRRLTCCINLAPSADKEVAVISRRQLFYSGAALTGAGLFAPLWPGRLLAAEGLSAQQDVATFQQFSLFLTERENLDPELSLRILAQCTEADPGFPEQVRSLWHSVQQQGLSSVSQFSASPLYQDDKRTQTVVQKIVSAWYLGYTGTPVSLRAVDDTRLVSFTGALAYSPTLDATVIPTYSRGQTNYWSRPPNSLASD
ncbi:sorbitol dehydrogenase family protein [Pseudomonas sp. 5P_3.1_Bac2]|uniref:sorbitol dehydrogenase family protein n=1 Tax=Pseudomonas sp. 5P_3.1_Bac2 TaxID=2971617 RepID=UPI0021C909A5|nr:sorbitol dehydrogenase family protein [Pseudomonas sp. 5P_3.1_Bac2]MCU1719538.1 sorbitol dehydrogenase family protein [Pseudomonas sp. 5P_3.1_Bac2]